MAPTTRTQAAAAASAPTARKQAIANSAKTASPSTQSSLETAAAIYFYGQRDPAFGFLSNFHPCRFVDDAGRTFYSSEQYFMKRKQELFDPTNDALAVAILKAKSPPVAKKLGRQVQHFDERVWHATRMDAMVDALKLKFSSDAALRDALLATEHKQLYEAARTDRIWGIGVSVDQIRESFRTNRQFRETGDLSEVERTDWFGTNLLGQALMTTRTWLLATTGQESVVDRISKQHEGDASDDENKQAAVK